MSNDVNNLFLAEIVTPEKMIFSGNVEMITVPGAAGEFSVLARHVPLISSIKAGIVSIFSENGEKINFFVFDGFIEVSTKSVILVENAIATLAENGASIEQTIDEIKKDLSGNNQDYQSYFLVKKLEFYQEMLKFVKDF